MTNRRKAYNASFGGSGVTTTISITLVLLLLGLTILVGIMGKRLSTLVKENISITVEIPDNVKDAEIKKIQNELNKAPYVKEIRFITKEEIKKQLIADLGKDPEEILGYNPASNCYEINLKSEYANSDSIKVVEKSLKQKKIIQEILYNQEDLDMVNENLSKLGMAMLLLAIILMLISFTLIRNTIRLNIYSKRFTINTMQLVGATNSFIRKPFLGQMVTYGVIAALLSSVIITVIAFYAIKEYIELTSILTQYDLFAVYASVLILGVLLTVIATYFAVNRYLKMNKNNLYHI